MIKQTWETHFLGFCGSSGPSQSTIWISFDWPGSVEDSDWSGRALGSETFSFFSCKGTSTCSTSSPPSSVGVRETESAPEDWFAVKRDIKVVRYVSKRGGVCCGLWHKGIPSREQLRWTWSVYMYSPTCSRNWSFYLVSSRRVVSISCRSSRGGDSASLIG